MSRLVAADRGALAFAEQLLTILREGRFVATYKYAVILGLMDLCLEKSTRTGAAPGSVTTRELAEKIIDLYWPHSRPFRGGDVLRQNAGRQAGILQEIVRFRERTSPAATSPSRARLAAPAEWQKLSRKVEWILVQMPLPKLQRIGNEVVPFVYWIQWDDDVRRGEFNSPEFDNLIRFTSGSGDHLVRLSGLLRPLVCTEWAARVAHLNDDVVDEPELDRFLFGVERSSLSAVRGPLTELQQHRCFYCADRLTSRTEVDHFIPWARYPDNGLDNLVVAHGRCNGAKRDHLAAADHVGNWMEHLAARNGALEDLVQEIGWPRHRERTVAVARSIYLRLPEGARLWRIGEEFVPVQREALGLAFAASQAALGARRA